MADYASTPPAHPDDSHDAALLLNLKQSDPNRTTPVGRVTPLGKTQQLGTVILTSDVIEALWAEYYCHYHPFVPVLAPDVDNPSHVLGRSKFLFWTIIMVGSRHFQGDTTLFGRLQAPYKELVKEMVTKAPARDQHHAVKALCLLCSWPLPVTSTTDDMTFTNSGIMMKFAMHLGIHRPSSPADFNNIPINLRAEQITDRLRTWACCNLVAQNVSTGYGQPPETVWDSTLVPQGVGHVPHALVELQSRIPIEQAVDNVTRTIYRLEQPGTDLVKEAKREMGELSLSIDINNGTTSR